MNIDFIIKLVTIASGLGTFLATIVAIFTLVEVKKQRISAQKPQILFDNFVTCLLLPNNDQNEIPVNWRMGYNSWNSGVKFSMINAGQGVAKHISFEYKLDIQKFISIIKREDKSNEIQIEIKGNWIDFNSTRNRIDQKTILKVNRKVSDQLEYLLPRSLQESPSGFFIPNEYLLLISCVFYLSNQYKFSINLKNIPKILLRTSYKDISGNISNTYHALSTFHFESNKFHFALKEIKKKQFYNTKF